MSYFFSGTKANDICNIAVCLFPWRERRRWWGVQARPGAIPELWEGLELNKTTSNAQPPNTFGEFKSYNIVPKSVKVSQLYLSIQLKSAVASTFFLVGFQPKPTKILFGICAGFNIFVSLFI